MPSGKKIYWIMALLSVSSYAWIAFQIYFSHAVEKGLSLCLVKNVTGFPCPSCGITRSLLILATGDAVGAFMINPLGLVAGFVLVIIPIWLVADILTAKYSLAEFFLQVEGKVKAHRALYIPAIVFILANWSWNVIKEL